MRTRDVTASLDAAHVVSGLQRCRPVCDGAHGYSDNGDITLRVGSSVGNSMAGV
jgi:hypothetical protein